jgi:hypothetical protein
MRWENGLFYFHKLFHTHIIVEMHTLERYYTHETKLFETEKRGGSRIVPSTIEVKPKSEDFT